MKRVAVLIAVLLCAMPAFAQTAEEIISRMEEVMGNHEKDGIVMTIDIKIPILGTTSSRSYILGDKMRVEMTMMGTTAVNWTDGVTDWTYDSKKNEIEIENATPEDGSSNDNEAEMFKGITEGYDVSIKKETADAWHILCKKSKTNKEKDDPDKMDLVVAKETYYPVSLSAKISGVRVTLRDISYGVTEKQVTFNPADYPDAKIIDKR